MNHAPTASMTIHLFADGKISLGTKGNLSTLVRQMEAGNFSREVAETKPAKEVTAICSVRLLPSGQIVIREEGDQAAMNRLLEETVRIMAEKQQAQAEAA